MSTYNGVTQAKNESELDRVFEELQLTGYSVIENFFSSEQTELLKVKSLEIYSKQEELVGKEALNNINDADIARNVVAYDKFFLEIAKNPRVLEIVEHFLKPNFILSLSNVIINRAGVINHQSKWHRDFPYQDFISDEMLGFNALVALTDFEENNGATIVLPFSNKFKKLPSDEYLSAHAEKVICPAGSLILFDSMLFHKAGINKSTKDRVALNLNYIRPFLKQQYTNLDLDDDPILGRRFLSAEDDIEFRNKRF